MERDMTEPVGEPPDELAQIFNVLTEVLSALQRIAKALEKLAA
jgi:hypothetical protein